jgi:hypothetical protein
MATKNPKPKIVKVPSEAQEQRWLVKWIKSNWKIRKFVIKTNNEGKRTVIQGRNLKLMGMRAGASDLFLAYPNKTQTKAGLWLEVKRNMRYPPSAKKTDTWLAEEEFIEDMQNVGFAGNFCYGWEDGKKIIETYLLT